MGAEAPKIKMRWHWRDQEIASKCSLRKIAKNWMRKRMFAFGDDLEWLLHLEGGEGSWWYSLEYGWVRGGKGRIRVNILGRSKSEEFSMRELYKEVLEEKEKPRLFDL